MGGKPARFPLNQSAADGGSLPHGTRHAFPAGTSLAGAFGSAENSAPMSEHDKQTAFLKDLIRCEDNEQHRELEGRMSQAEQDERVVLCALRLVGVLSALALAGLCYAVLFTHDWPHERSNLLLKVFLALGLSACICLVTFSGAWCWYRAMLNRLQEECRRLMRAELKQRFDFLRTSPFPRAVKEQNISLYRNETATVEDSAEPIPWSKAI
jgi:hypothetical protein